MIKNIEIVDGPTMEIGQEKLYPVLVTKSNWIFWEKKFKAYPTNYGPTYWGPNIVFFLYVDETGEQLSYNDSKQINNFCRIKGLK